MLDLSKYCEYLYTSMYIPIYIYKNSELSKCYPEQDTKLYPPDYYIKKLILADLPITYTITRFHSYYGIIRLNNSSDYIVIGPVNDFIYTQEELNHFSNEYNMNSEIEEFSIFFANIPVVHLETFLNKLLEINYVLNNTILKRNEINITNNTIIEKSINEQYLEKVFEDDDESSIYNSYKVERKLINYIATGNIKGIKKLYIQANNTRVGIVAENNLRQFRNIFITLVTLASRAAIQGGLSPKISFTLSNVYIKQVERLTSIETIMELIHNVQLDYTRRVASLITPTSSDNMINKAIQYVQTNTNKHICVEDIADHVNLSRSYLSRKFKKEIGFDLSSYIRKSKLEESKYLLQFTNKSNGDISSYLCFSSQSHFQKLFKDIYGITPQGYRQSVK